MIQELYGLLLGDSAVRALMLESASQAGLDSDRLSFTHAITLLTSAIPAFQMVMPSQHQRLQQRLMQDLSTSLLPPRRLRVNPRVVKSKRAKFPLRHLEHRKPPKPQKAFQDVVVLLTTSKKLLPSASLPASEPCLVLLN